MPDGSSGSGRNRSARLDDQLLGGFIQTDEGAIGIARLLVSFQHVFHGGDEAGVGVRRDHPLPIAVGHEDVFFRVLPIVLSLAFSTMFNSTTFSSSRRRPPPTRPPSTGCAPSSATVPDACPRRSSPPAVRAAFYRWGPWRSTVPRWPELTKWQFTTHKRTYQERYAAFWKASAWVRSGLNPSMFSDRLCSTPQT